MCKFYTLDNILVGKVTISTSSTKICFANISDDQTLSIKYKVFRSHVDH